MDGEYEWSKNFIDVAALFKQPPTLPLPTLVRLPSSKSRDRRDDDVIYLLYATNRCEKIRAAELGRNGSELRTSGQKFLIPTSYSGWFVVGREAANLTIDTATTMLTSIEEIATTQTSIFLNHQPLHGFLQDRDPASGLIRFTPSTVAPVSVLSSAGTIFCNPPPEKSRCCGCRWKGEKNQRHKPEDVLYLQCTTKQQSSLFVPLKTTGQFTKIASRSENQSQQIASDSVMQINALGQGQYSFPLTAKLVSGTRPDTVAFTGLFELQDRLTEISVIGSVVAANGPLAFVELQHNSGVQFQVAQNWDDVKNHSNIKEAINFCKSRFDSYKTEIQLVTEYTDTRVKPHLPPKPKIRLNIPKQSVHAEANEARPHAFNQLAETSFIHQLGLPTGDRRKGLCYRTSSSSAPSMPPPEIPTAEHHLSAFDEEGFLIPLENRTPATDSDVVLPPLEFRTEKRSEKSPHTIFQSPLENIYEIPLWDLYVNISPPTVPVEQPAVHQPPPQHSPMITCDPERLESFLEDSVAAVNKSRQPTQVSSNRNFTEGRRSSDIVVTGGIQHQRLRSDNDIRNERMLEDESDDVITSSTSQLHMHQLPMHLRSSYHGNGSKADSGLGTWRRFDIHHHSQELFSETWIPPSDVESMTVEEVLMGLRYIGTREALVARFGEEQIDGKLLVEMNDELLREGFSDMNALERKKVLDFARGWRPKRALII